MLYNFKREVIVRFVDISGLVDHRWQNDDAGYVLDHYSELDFYSASSLKQQSAGRDVASLEHIIMNPRQIVCARYH